MEQLKEVKIISPIDKYKDSEQIGGSLKLQNT